jgi:hypothetical protein
LSALAMCLCAGFVVSVEGAAVPEEVCAIAIPHNIAIPMISFFMLFS